MDEPNPQGGHEIVGHEEGLDVRQTPQDPPRPSSLRVHLQSLDDAAKSVQAKPASPCGNGSVARRGTEHLRPAQNTVRDKD
jgi:hypothetical protein